MLSQSSHHWFIISGSYPQNLFILNHEWVKLLLLNFRNHFCWLYCFSNCHHFIQVENVCMSNSSIIFLWSLTSLSEIIQFLFPQVPQGVPCSAKLVFYSLCFSYDLNEINNRRTPFFKTDIVKKLVPRTVKIKFFSVTKSNQVFWHSNNQVEIYLLSLQI